MSPELERLIHLQRLDTTIEEARRQIAAHPQRLAEADARLREANERVDAARQRLKDSQDARRALEKEAAVFQGRVTKFKDQLLDVKTNREYQAIQHEIATAQSELGASEERVLERMLEADAITVEIKQADAALASDERTVNAEKAALADALTAVQKTLDQASAERTAVLAQVEGHLIALFEQVARARKGVAICAATHDGLCSACHVRLRPQVFQEVRRNDAIIQCFSCNRILYYVAPPPPVEPALTHPS